MKAAVPIKDISDTEFGVPEAGVTSSGGTKDSVSFGVEYPVNQWIVVGEPAVSQTAKQLMFNGVM